jgi:trigger factor
MEVELIKDESAQKKIQVTCSKEEWSNYLNQVLEDLSKELDIEGFRKGEVPPKVVREKIGEETVQGKAAQLAVEKTYPQAIEELELRPLSQPEVQVTKISKSGKLEYKAEFAVEPEIELGDYKDIEIDEGTKQETVGEEEVQDSLKHLQKRQADVENVERASQEGDRVEIDFVARHKDVKVEGGESENHPLVIGEGQFPEDFENELIGMKKGDTKEFSVQFPDDFSRSEFAGKKIDFKVTMKLVQDIELPELNDEFAQSLGQFDDLDDLKEKLKQGVAQEKQQERQKRIDQKILDAVVEDSEIEIAPQLIEREKNNMMEEFKGEVSRMGMEFEEYLEKLGQDKEELRDSWDENAKKRLQIRFALDKIAQKEEIEVDEERLEEELQNQLKNLNPEKTEESLDEERLRAYTEKKLQDEKVMDFLRDQAQTS